MSFILIFLFRGLSLRKDDLIDDKEYHHGHASGQDCRDNVVDEVRHSQRSGCSYPDTVDGIYYQRHSYPAEEVTDDLRRNRTVASECDIPLQWKVNALGRKGCDQIPYKIRKAPVRHTVAQNIESHIRRMTSHHADAAITSDLKNIPQLLNGLEDDTYQLIILPYRPKDPGLICSRLCDEALFFYLDRQHPFAGRESLSVKEMNGENMLLFHDIGFWHDLVLEKMPDSRFLMQSERYSFQELIANSTLSVFTSDAYPDESPDSRRVRVPIDDPEFHVTYYLACKKEHGRKFRGIFLR